MSFTHVIVGAGSAGCIVAARVAENQNFNVLLLEAGPDCQEPETRVPFGVISARRVPMKGQSETFDSNIDWTVKVSLPDGKSTHVPQARLVGGGSSINGGTALRNTVADSQEWVALGNNAWDFQSVCQTYEKLENDELRNTYGAHPIARANISEAGKIQRAFAQGAASIGFSAVEDLNATGAEGVGPSPVCRTGDRRISAADTFIGPIRNAPNFTIMPNSHVDKILISNGQACAAVLVSGDQIEASQEILVCAGAIFSPAILQRSGIGPASLLQQLQIPLVRDLPAGRNLSDHPCIPVVARPRVGAYQDTDYSLQWQARWSSSEHPGAIDAQMVCFSYLFVAANSSNGEQGLAGTATGHVAGIGCNVNKPTSLGTVAIRTNDAHDQPDVSPNYLQTLEDMRVAREVVRHAYRVITGSAMGRVVEDPLTLTNAIVSDDESLDQWIKSQYSSTYHFTGTCRMALPENDGVVDQSGRVYGVHGLRVADASVIPTVPASNTMWSTMMFAERIGCSVRDTTDVKPVVILSRL
ncbi:hypothetical protein LTR05_005627 [Lithohypha guttulata]|uniref:Glucose-methanol-choline oxidoreductase N-terminal domain-containing protein n=1 Tax=Lithohypha guttulata TaxID=1690604 RepID=A0AAN7Y641_9EURO|nr:hypothetical protein LTR05_005627 [Lithohypha guttulata]